MTDDRESLGDRIRALVCTWARSQQALVGLAADFADGKEWHTLGSPSAAHWIASVGDIEVSTAREWIRVGRSLRELQATAQAFGDGRLSYSKVRTLTRVATPENEAELLEIAAGVPAGLLGRTLAAWAVRNTDGDELDRLHQQQRSVRWWVEPDGMVTFSLRLPPITAGVLIAWLTSWVMTSRPAEAPNQSKADIQASHASADAWPTIAQQHADAFAALLAGGGEANTEVILHVRGDGCTLDDGTPVADNAVAAKLPEAMIRAMIHDAERRPINASTRHRHPTNRQRRIVKERDRCCVDCGRRDLLQFDHDPPYDQSKRTIVDELRLRCAPCHRARHADDQ
ncbi:MAG: HNH endonuclease [Acidimicrobiales bacterium]